MSGAIQFRHSMMCNLAQQIRLELDKLTYIGSKYLHCRRCQEMIPTPGKWNNLFGKDTLNSGDFLENVASGPEPPVEQSETNNDGERWRWRPARAGVNICPKKSETVYPGIRGILKLSVLVNQKIFKTVYQNI